jgi:hypothetical protein
MITVVVAVAAVVVVVAVVLEVIYGYKWLRLWRLQQW